MTILTLTDFLRKHPLASVFIFAFVVRAALFFILPIPDQLGGDFSLYQRIADNILLQGNLGGEPHKTYGSPSISPGWAFFLSGYELFFGSSTTALLALSATLGGLLAVGSYLIANLFFGRAAALATGIAVSLWPAFLIQAFQYGSSLLLYSALFVFGVFFFLKAAYRGSWFCTVVSGVLLGFAALVDAIGFFVPLVLAVWLFVVKRSRHSILLALILLTAAGLVIAPWTYRNVMIAEQLGLSDGVPLVSKGELQLLSPARLSGVAETVTDYTRVVPALAKLYVFPFGIAELASWPVSVNAPQEAFSYKELLPELLQGRAVALSTGEWVVLWVKVAITILHWVVLVLALLAFVSMSRGGSWGFPLLVALLAGYVTVAVTGYTGGQFKYISEPSSFIFPLMPLFIALASFSLVWLFGALRRSGRAYI